MGGAHWNPALLGVTQCKSYMCLEDMVRVGILWPGKVKLSITLIAPIHNGVVSERLVIKASLHDLRLGK